MLKLMLLRDISKGLIEDTILISPVILSFVRTSAYAYVSKQPVHRFTTSGIVKLLEKSGDLVSILPPINELLALLHWPTDVPHDILPASIRGKAE